MIDDEACPSAQAFTSCAKSDTAPSSSLRSTVTVDPHSLECAVALASGGVLVARPASAAQNTMKPYFDKFDAHNNAEEYRESEQVVRQALAIAERSYQNQPSMIGVWLNNLGMMCYSLGKYEESESSFKRSLAILERSDGPESERVAIRRSSAKGWVTAGQEGQNWPAVTGGKRFGKSGESLSPNLAERQPRTGVCLVVEVDFQRAGGTIGT